MWLYVKLHLFKRFIKVFEYVRTAPLNGRFDRPTQRSKSLFHWGIWLCFIYSCYPLACRRTVSAKLGFYHTFFLPKRERKYQRKRFRAAARTPRGHRSCSALSALEMGRRLQRCNCISQNEATAPLMGKRLTFSAVAMTYSLRRRRERGLVAV